MELFFETVGSNTYHVNILFGLLEQRVHRISHQSLPTYAEHQDFVLNHPYRVWYLVKDEDGYIGSVYVTDQNTIGINIVDSKLKNTFPRILEKIKSEFDPLPAVISVRAGRFSVNVPPSNSTLLAVLEEYDCRVAQISFFV